MMTLFVAKSLNEVADLFTGNAAREELGAKEATRSDKKVFMARANTWIAAANFIRNCRIDPKAE